jgi:hypothetical protein
LVHKGKSPLFVSGKPDLGHGLEPQAEEGNPTSLAQWLGGEVGKMTSAPGEDALDGMKVDQQGNLYVSGPGGLWILSPSGKHLGTIRGPEHPHNLAWGQERSDAKGDGKTLYLAAQTGLYRVRLSIPGIWPPRGASSGAR